MRDGQSPESLEARRIETEWSEMKLQVMKQLRVAFADVLPPEDLERRLETISDTQFVSAQDFERLTEQYPNEADADGVMRIEVHGQNVRRYAVVKQTASRADTLHTFAHEATHLMAPESNRVADPMREGEDEQVYSVYLGPLRHERFVYNGKVDPMSVYFDKPKQRALFWEAVTDWHADEMLGDVLSDDEKKEVETGGYLERHYISYLIDHAPDREQIIREIRQAYATGEEGTFIFALRELTNRRDDNFYEELLDVLKLDPTDWETRIDKWMETVNKYFPV
ncbi:MAG: hypothetical protein AAB413_05805 [Patescibacteria group bacterium]